MHPAMVITGGSRGIGAASARLLAARGHAEAIVNRSPAAARPGSPGEYVDYAASKGAIDTFTIGLVREVAGAGVRANAVRPGPIETGFHATGGDPGRSSDRRHDPRTGAACRSRPPDGRSNGTGRTASHPEPPARPVRRRERRASEYR